MNDTTEISDLRLDAPISIDYREYYENYNLKPYIDCKVPHESRIPSDRETELSLKSDYSGRELFEIIQNADDQKAKSLEIELKGNSLRIRNDGGNPFSNKGLLSVLRPHQSPKKRGGSLSTSTIGNKGLGIRSLLNWSDGMTIHSNGVKVEFSELIAKQKWAKIIRLSPSLAVLETSDKCPLAILSVPKVSVDDVTVPDDSGRWTTEIEIQCQAEVLDDVKSKMNGIGAEVLLFLKNIRSISLICAERQPRSLVRKDLTTPCINETSMRLTETDCAGTLCVDYVLHRVEGTIGDLGEYEVAVAYPLDSDLRCRYLFSYFPTRIPLNLPCVVHANFHLNMSRDGIVIDEFNSEVMTKLGALLAEVAIARARTLGPDTPDNLRRLPLEMLLLDESAKTYLPEFAEAVAERFGSSKVIPTIFGEYASCDDGVYHSQGKGFENFLKRHVPDIGNRLRRYVDAATYGLLTRHAKTPAGLNILASDLSELAAGLDDTSLAEMIVLLTGVIGWHEKPRVLRLEDGSMANPDVTTYILKSKDMTAAAGADITDTRTATPMEIELNILKPSLSRTLQELLSTDARGVTDKLRFIATVSDADYSKVKERIETWSKATAPRRADYRERIAGVVEWLYNRRSGSDSSDAPRCHRFHLPDAEWNPRPACSLMLESADSVYRLNPAIRNLIPEDKRKAFFVDFLGCAEAVPLTGVDFRNDSHYISIAWDDAWVNYVNKSGASKNIALVPVSDFIKDLSTEKLLRLILSDSRLLNITTGLQRVCYSYYGDKEQFLSLSYTAYWLSRRDGAPLSSLRNYILKSDESLVAEMNNRIILDSDKLKSLGKSGLDSLLGALGAKETTADLTYSQLYELLENKTEPDRINTFYKEVRRIILDKESKSRDRGPTEADKSILTHVWAKLGGGPCELRPKDEVFYWDNSRLPVKFLASLWKLCLGARTGEKSVQRLFGVKLLSDLNLHVVNYSGVNNTLTNELAGFLRRRFKYLVAASLSSGDNENRTIYDKASRIRSFIKSLRISASVTYESGDTTFEAAEGDIVSDETGFYICCSLKSLDAARANPQFCSNIAKGLCMQLLIGVENELAFKHIVEASHESAEYEWNELDDKLRSDIIHTIGVAENEKRFWNKLGVTLDDNIDSDPAERRRTILASLPDIALPEQLTDVSDMSGHRLYTLLSSLSGAQVESLQGLYSLREYYHEVLAGINILLYESYRRRSFRRVRDNIAGAPDIATVRGWTDQLDEFRVYIENHLSSGFDVPDEYLRMEIIKTRYIDSVKKRYPMLEGKADEPKPEILPQYIDILNSSHVDADEFKYNEQAITYFDGFEEEFKKMVEGKVKSEELKVSPQGEPPLRNGTETITFFSSDKHKKSGGGGGGGAFTSSQAKGRMGKSAERRVMEYLESHPEIFSSATDVSRQHKYHCDICYYLKGNPDIRYLEVKSVNSGKIYLTPGEIQESDKHDIALVYGDNIQIIQNAFCKGSPLMNNLTPSGYEVTIIMGPAGSAGEEGE